MDHPPARTNLARAALLGFAALAPLLSLGLALRGASVWLALAPLFASHMLLLYATLVPNCQWWGPIFTRFRTTTPEVWLTIDDGPSPVHTLKMLDLLAQFEARATFFVIGARAEKYPHLITEILARGHALANHTQTHPSGSFWCAGPATVGREIDQCAETLRTTPARAAHFFRAPAGLKNMFLHPALRRRGLGLIGWTVRGLDTVMRDPAKVAAGIAKHARPGAIIVLHEGHRERRAPDFHLQCLEQTLQTLVRARVSFRHSGAGTTANVTTRPVVERQRAGC